jgi:histone acetyltransferase (RNA polymerase elongator complex component)
LAEPLRQFPADATFDSDKLKKMASKNIIYPIFLPHAGCPFQCVYCNQRAVTSVPSHAATPAGILSSFKEQFTRILGHAREKEIPGELAFYGGTFTALPQEVIEIILESVTPWVEAGVFSGIRFSTRPDGITQNICSLLKEYPVKSIELGVQSLADEVLILSRRGYCVVTVENAVALVHKHGWQLGLQLMLGLPGDSQTRFMDSVAKAVGFRPAFVRIYPTLVLAGTLLADWRRTGSFESLSLEEAVSWCVPAYEVFFQEHIPIARLGLHPDPELQKPGTVLAGPYHPAFGYLVRVRWWRDRVDRYVLAHHGLIRGRELTLRVPDRSLSEVVGPAKSNVKYWMERWGLKDVRVEVKTGQPPGQFDCFLD